MMMAASKMCARGVRFRSVALVIGSDTLYDWIGDNIDYRYESSTRAAARARTYMFSIIV